MKMMLKKILKSIKDELYKFLPNYMIPKKINFLKEFPMNINGKVDRKKLKEIIDSK